MLNTYIVLLAAHVLGDFLLQTDGMVRNKRKLWVLVIHSILHGGLVYVLIQQWSAWQIPVAVAVLHSVIDWVKGRCPRCSRSFLLDQASHAASLAVIAGAGLWLGWCVPFHGLGWEWIVGGAGFVASVFVVGFFVGGLAGKIVDANGGA